MQIAVISDTHDRIDYTSLAIARMKELGLGLAIHCGDIHSPETVKLFAEIPTHFVFGNWDKQKTILQTAIESIGGTLHPRSGYLELVGKKIAWCHSHIRGELADLKRSNQFDYLFYGHTHDAEAHRAGKTLLVNPGAMFRIEKKTFAIVDLVSGEVRWEVVELEKEKP